MTAWPTPGKGRTSIASYGVLVRVRRTAGRTLGVTPRRLARPLLVEDLRQILAAVDRTTAAGNRDAALILLGFASALRRSELAALDVADIISKPGGLLITVRRPKGDPHAVGVSLRRADPSSRPDDARQLLHSAHRVDDDDFQPAPGPVIRAVPHAT